MCPHQNNNRVQIKVFAKTLMISMRLISLSMMKRRQQMLITTQKIRMMKYIAHMKAQTFVPQRTNNLYLVVNRIKLQVQFYPLEDKAIQQVTLVTVDKRIMVVLQPRQEASKTRIIRIMSLSSALTARWMKTKCVTNIQTCQMGKNQNFSSQVLSNLFVTSLHSKNHRKRNHSPSRTTL